MCTMSECTMSSVKCLNVLFQCVCLHRNAYQVYVQCVFTECDCIVHKCTRHMCNMCESTVLMCAVCVYRLNAYNVYSGHVPCECTRCACNMCVSTCTVFLCTMCVLCVQYVNLPYMYSECVCVPCVSIGFVHHVCIPWVCVQ